MWDEKRGMERASKQERKIESVMHVPIVPALVVLPFLRLSTLYDVLFVLYIHRSQLLPNLSLRKRQLRIQYLLQKFQITFSTLNLSCETAWRERSKTEREKTKTKLHAYQYKYA